MFTQNEKEFLLMVLNSVVPQAKDRAALRAALDVQDSIIRKLEALSVEVPVEPPPGALSPELVKTAEETTGKRKRH